MAAPTIVPGVPCADAAHAPQGACDERAALCCPPPAASRRSRVCPGPRPPPRAVNMEVDVGSLVSGLSGGDGAGAGPVDEDQEMEGAPSCSGARPVPFEFERSRSESSGDEDDDEDEEEEEMEEEELEGDPGTRFGTDDGDLDSDDDREVKSGTGGRGRRTGCHPRNGCIVRQAPLPACPGPPVEACGSGGKGGYPVLQCATIAARQGPVGGRASTTRGERSRARH